MLIFGMTATTTTTICYYLDLLLGLSQSLSSCVMPEEVLRQGKPSAGVVSAKDEAGFLKYLEHEKCPDAKQNQVGTT